MAFDRRKLTAIAHGAHVFWTPMGEARAELLLELLRTQADPLARVLDLGCGRAELLIRLCERGAHGVGVDSNPYAIAIAREQAARRLPPDAIELLEMDAGAFDAPDDSFDVALCVAATHARGGLAPALDVLTRWVRPGGLVVIGEGYWQRPPEREYLAAIGAIADEMTDLDTLLATFPTHGLRVLSSSPADAGEWRDYEARYHATMEAYAAAHPGDPDAIEMRDHVRRWNAAAMRWGLETMGLAYIVAAG